MSRNALALLVLATELMVAASVTAVPNPKKPSDEQRYIIKFKPGAHRAGVQAVQQNGVEPLVEDETYEFVAGHMNDARKAAMERNPHVEYIEVDQIREPLQALKHTTEHIIGQSTPYGVNMVLDGFTNPTSTLASSSTGVILCIIDSGYDLSHVDLPKNFVTGINDTRSGTWFKDGCTHGTHVAGTIVAMNNTIGVVGVNANLGGVALHIVKVFGTDTTTSCSWGFSSTLVSALSKCQMKASAGGQKLVVSMSLGGPWNSTTENTAFQKAYNTGNVISVAAAGNSGNTAYSFPASYPSVISVACVDSNKNLCGFSQRNSQVDLAAPGLYITSTIPGSQYATYSGTSMSTPHVSAAAAMLWSHYATKTNGAIWESLTSTAQDLGAAGRDDSFGYGLISVRRAYQWLGSH